jgi:tRNA uridine 5-carbamoylmethylation protein Kti12
MASLNIITGTPGAGKTSLAKLEVPIVYVILRLPFEEALRRAKERDQSFDDRIVQKLHPQFEAVGPYERHVIDISELPPDEVLERFRELRYRCVLDAKELADTMQ